jgi:transcriptional regulator GlxA family with amidase domain
MAERSIITSAGPAAVIDMCLHLMRREHGAAEITNRIARYMVVLPHRDGGPSGLTEPAEPGDGDRPDLPGPLVDVAEDPPLYPARACCAGRR